MAHASLLNNSRAGGKNQYSAPTNLYVNNFGEELNETQLYQLFAQFGTVTSLKVETDGQNRSKGFGYVHFERPEMAEMAINQLNGYKLPSGKHMFVGQFMNKNQRLKSFRQSREVEQRKRVAHRCLYISNLDTSIYETQLAAIFSKFGTVTSVEVLQKDNQSKGIALIGFETEQEAMTALEEMNGKWVLSKPIYVKLSESTNQSKVLVPNFPTTSNCPLFNAARSAHAIEIPAITNRTSAPQKTRRSYPYDSLSSNDQ